MTVDAASHQQFVDGGRHSGGSVSRGDDESAARPRGLGKNFSADEIYVRSYPAGSAGPWQVSSNGGIEPQWRADGREVYYLTANKRLMAVPIAIAGHFHAETPNAESRRSVREPRDG
jgi:hypothetical protein